MMITGYCIMQRTILSNSVTLLSPQNKNSAECCDIRRSKIMKFLLFMQRWETASLFQMTCSQNAWEPQLSHQRWTEFSCTFLYKNSIHFCKQPLRNLRIRKISPLSNIGRSTCGPCTPFRPCTFSSRHFLLLCRKWFLWWDAFSETIVLPPIFLRWISAVDCSFSVHSFFSPLFFC